MKKENILVTLILSAALFLSACGRETVEPTLELTQPAATEAASVTEAVTEAPTETPTEPRVEFDVSGIFPETVLLQNKDLIVTAAGLDYEESQAVLRLSVENLTEEPMFLSLCSRFGALISVNGRAVPILADPLRVESQSRAMTEIRLPYDLLLDHGIGRISEICFSLGAEGYDTGFMTLSTGAAPETFWETVTENPQSLSWQVLYQQEKKEFERSGVRHTGTALIRNSGGEELLYLDFENSTRGVRYLDCDGFAVNGLQLSPAGELLTLLPQSHSLLAVNLTELFKENGLNRLGIEKLGSFSFTGILFDENGKKLLTPAQVRIVPDPSVPDFQAAGVPVSETGDLKIYSGGLAESAQGAEKCMNLLIPMENTSGHSFLAQSMSLTGKGRDLEIWKGSTSRETDGWSLLVIPIEKESMALAEEGGLRLTLLTQIKGSREQLILEIPNP